MGGRGSSSGTSIKRNKYGSQYHTLFQSGNIKFVEANSRNVESLHETMTKNRVYVRVGSDNIIQILYYDSENKRKKTIDLKHNHNGMKPHVHHGYEHNEYDNEKGATRLTDKERKMVDKVYKLWDNYISNRG